MAVEGGRRAERGPSAIATTNDRRRLHGSIAHDIAVAVIGGRHLPGDALPTEDEASRQLGVSRTAYREAIRILAAKGLVDSRPRTGTRIAPRARWNMIDPDVLAWHFEVEPSPAFIGQLFELRSIVEPSAAALAAQRRSGADLDALGAALATMRDAPLASDHWGRADLDFHHAILVATHNEALLSLSSGIGATISWSNLLKIRTGLRDPFTEHADVLAAIEAGDAAAAREAMQSLVALSNEDVRASLGRLGREG